MPWSMSVGKDVHNWTRLLRTLSSLQGDVGSGDHHERLMGEPFGISTVRNHLEGRTHTTGGLAPAESRVSVKTLS